MPWTETIRPDYDRRELRYASDLRDHEWTVIAPFMPEPNRIGRPRKTVLREVVNAIFYIAATGCQWRMLPKDFPPYSTVQGYFYRWRDDGTWPMMNHHLVMAERERQGREALPIPKYRQVLLTEPIFSACCRIRSLRRISRWLLVIGYILLLPGGD